MGEDGVEQGGLGKDALTPKDRAMLGAEAPDVAPEKSETAKPHTHEQKILGGIRKRSESDGSPKMAIKDGIALVDANLKDRKEFGLDTKEYAQLPDLLLDVMSGDTENLTYEQFQLIRQFFKSQRTEWGKLAYRPARAEVPEFASNRDIYGAVLIEINKSLPTPESALPYIPRYDHARLEPLLEPLLKKNTLTVDDLVPVYKAFSKAASETQEQANADNPLWEKQKEGIDKARKEWAKISPKDRQPLLIINKPPDEVRIEPFKGALPDKPKDGFAYILDINDDWDREYMDNIDKLDLIAEQAKEGVVGIEALAGEHPKINSKQLEGIRLLEGYLQQGMQTGKVDEEKYKSVSEAITEVIINQALPVWSPI